MNINKHKFLITSYQDVKLNYWAIPKSANTTVKATLLQKKTKNPYKQQKWVHKPWNNPYIDDKEALSNGNINFTVTRHPYDRFVSLYKHFGLLEPFKELDIKPNKIAFEDFLNFVITEFKNDNTCNYHARSQLSYISYDQKNIIVDKFVDVNNFAKFSLSYNKPMIIANKSLDNPINLNNSQKEKIYYRYVDDFSALGYKR